MSHLIKIYTVCKFSYSLVVKELTLSEKHTCVVNGNPNKYNKQHTTANTTIRHHFFVLSRVYSSRNAVTIVSTIVNIVVRPIRTIRMKKNTLHIAGISKWLTVAGKAMKTKPVSAKCIM